MITVEELHELEEGDEVVLPSMMPHLTDEGMRLRVYKVGETNVPGQKELSRFITFVVTWLGITMGQWTLSTYLVGGKEKLEWQKFM